MLTRPTPLPGTEKIGLSSGSSGAITSAAATPASAGTVNGAAASRCFIRPRSLARRERQGRAARRRKDVCVWDPFVNHFAAVGSLNMNFMSIVADLPAPESDSVLPSAR